MKPRFVKVENSKPCIFCGKPTFYLAKPTNERSHADCWGRSMAKQNMSEAIFAEGFQVFDVTLHGPDGPVDGISVRFTSEDGFTEVAFTEDDAIQLAALVDGMVTKTRERREGGGQ